MAFLLLQNRFGLRAIVDDDQEERLNSYIWFFRKSSKNGHAFRIEVDSDGGVFKRSLHNEILPPREGFLVDHIDRDGLNNRRGNLRYATSSQNQMNQSVREDSASGFKGVNQDPRNGYWRASISKDGMSYHLGSYSLKEEAGYAYNAAAAICFGEFAVLNEILEGQIRGRERIQARVKHILAGKANPIKSRKFLKPNNNTTSGHIGVTFRKDCRRWTAKINLEKGKTLYLGSEKSLDEAAYLYNLAARDLKGLDFDINIVNLSDLKKDRLRGDWDKKKQSL
jgi:hypothetical protein